MLIIVLYAQGTRQKSYGPILNLPILTDTDSNRFLGILTLPIPIFIHEYHTDTDTNFLKNTDILIPIIPITLGNKYKKDDGVWDISPDSALLGVTDT